MNAPAFPSLAQDAPAHDRAVEALYDRVFGPGRFAKVSYRVREGANCLYGPSRLAWREGLLVGACRLWSARCGGEPVVFLGPLAVDPGERGGGLGAALTIAASEAAEAQGARTILLVGDLAYFARCGFERAQAGAIILPGPVDGARVLLRGAPVTGRVTGAQSI
jgi:predicted N-acetyltransferase YhbS